MTVSGEAEIAEGVDRGRPARRAPVVVSDCSMIAGPAMRWPACSSCRARRHRPRSSPRPGQARWRERLDRRSWPCDRRQQDGIGLADDGETRCRNRSRHWCHGSRRAVSCGRGGRLRRGLRRRGTSSSGTRSSNRPGRHSACRRPCGSSPSGRHGLRRTAIRAFLPPSGCGGAGRQGDACASRGRRRLRAKSRRRSADAAPSAQKVAAARGTRISPMPASGGKEIGMGQARRRRRASTRRSADRGRGSATILSISVTMPGGGDLKRAPGGARGLAVIRAGQLQARRR